MTNEELILQYSYGIIEDWSELVKRIQDNNERTITNGILKSYRAENLSGNLPIRQSAPERV